jgi:hypothetical protein
MSLSQIYFELIGKTKVLGGCASNQLHAVATEDLDPDDEAAQAPHQRLKAAAAALIETHKGLS